MSGKRRKRRPLADVVPPELLEGYGGAYTAVTDAQGRTRYISMAEMVLERMGQPRPSPDHRIRHKDGDPINSCRDNLEWHLPADRPNTLKN